MKQATPKLSAEKSQFPVGIAMFALVGLTIVVYARTTSYSFVNFDDPLYVYQNPNVQHGFTLSSIGWAFTRVHANNWHPLTWLSHMLDWNLFGGWPGGHHLMSVLLHAGSSALLFIALVRLTRSPAPSFFVSAVFALHPLRVESVAWVSERKDVLCGLFFIMMLLAYARYAEKPDLKNYILTTIALVLALLSKPMAVTAPFVLLLLDYWPLNRLFATPGAWKRCALEKLPWIALIAASSAITFFVQRATGATRSLEWSPLPLRIANAIVSYVAYILQSIIPARLAVYYPYPQTGIPAALVVAALCVLMAITFVAWWLRRTRPYFLVGWLWYVGMLVPVIGILQVGFQARADRYMYLPQIGLAIIVAWLVYDAVRARPALRQPAILAALAVLLVCFGLTWRQVSFWRDSITLFTHAAEVTKDNAQAHTNLGHAYLQLGDLQQAAVHSQLAFEIDSGQDIAALNLGSIFLEQNRFKDAETMFTHAVTAHPENASAWYNLGATHARQGHNDEALRIFEKALAANPDHATAVLIGNAFFTLKHPVEAEKAYDLAVLKSPENVDAWLGLAMARNEQRRWNEALEAAREVLKREPQDGYALYESALAYSETGDVANADAALTALLAQQPGHAQAAALRKKLRAQSAPTPTK